MRAFFAVWTLGTMPIRQALGVTLWVAAAAVAHEAQSAALAVPALGLVLLPFVPRGSVVIEDSDRRAMREAIEAACADARMSLKEFAAVIGFHSSSDLLNTLKGLRKAEMFWRLLAAKASDAEAEAKLREFRRYFHLHWCVALGLPERIERSLKIAAYIGGQATQKRSA